MRRDLVAGAARTRDRADLLPLRDDRPRRDPRTQGDMEEGDAVAIPHTDQETAAGPEHGARSGGIDRLTDRCLLSIGALQVEGVHVGLTVVRAPVVSLDDRPATTGNRPDQQSITGARRRGLIEGQVVCRDVPSHAGIGHRIVVVGCAAGDGDSGATRHDLDDAVVHARTGTQVDIGGRPGRLGRLLGRCVRDRGRGRLRTERQVGRRGVTIDAVVANRVETVHQAAGDAHRGAVRHDRQDGVVRAWA